MLGRQKIVSDHFRIRFFDGGRSGVDPGGRRGGHRPPPLPNKKYRGQSTKNVEQLLVRYNKTVVCINVNTLVRALHEM